jgi:DNA gyrase subunit A
MSRSRSVTGAMPSACPLETYRQQARGGKGIRASDAKDDDFIEHVFVASTHDDLLCFTDTGRVFKIKVYELPEMSRTSKGRPIINFIELKEGERPAPTSPSRTSSRQPLPDLRLHAAASSSAPP